MVGQAILRTRSISIFGLIADGHGYAQARSFTSPLRHHLRTSAFRRISTRSHGSTTLNALRYPSLSQAFPKHHAAFSGIASPPGRAELLSIEAAIRRLTALPISRSLPRPPFTFQLFPKRFAHTRAGPRKNAGARRNKSSSTRKDPGAKDSSKSSTNAKSQATAGGLGGIYSRLPHISSYHRPTREELLAAATGFWSRLKIRFKWFSIRSVRPFNNDEIGALFSWVLLGNLVWIIVGTTTFVSLNIFLINTVFAQETLAKWVGNYLTKSSGVKVVFESAIVPRWKDGVITFKKVFVSRRPGQGTGKVKKGSPETAAAAAASIVSDGVIDAYVELEEDTNYTQYDLTIETVNVTLSFAKWFNGQGLLRDVEIKGVRGVVDRTHVRYDEDDVDPMSYRHDHNPGDFEINSFKMEDFLVTVHQPGGFRPFPVSIFSCDLPQLRQRWLFYDFLCANHVSGSFDESLFTIHPRQMHGPARSHFIAEQLGDDENSPWKKHTRLRIDGLKIEHLNRGTEGPFSWIHEGNVDLVADVMFPADNDENILGKLVSELKNTTLSGSRHSSDNSIDNFAANSMIQLQKLTAPFKPDEDKRFLVIDLRVNFHDVRAAIPLFTRDLSYVNNALIKPIVAYINSRKTFIPINSRLVKRVSDFDGSWTLYDSGLLDDLSAETYTAIVKDIHDDRARMRRFKKVGLWSLQVAIQALFMGMAGNLA